MTIPSDLFGIDWQATGILILVVLELYGRRPSRSRSESSETSVAHPIDREVIEVLAYEQKRRVWDASNHGGVR